ncbi:hypothetical protein Ndes2437A_g04548 [Nannochloris sp. 'desiccata']
MRVMDVEAPLNAGVPLSNEVPFDYKLNGTNFEGQQSAQQWRPSKKAILGSVAGLVVVAALVFGLIFGIEPSGSSSDNLGKALSANCKDIAQGNFWEYLVPDLYEINVDLQPELFKLMKFDMLTVPAADPVFNGRSAITFNVSQSTSCLVLHANNLTFSEISVATEGDEGPTSICSTTEDCNNVITRVMKEPIRGSEDIDLVAIDLNSAGIILEERTKPKVDFKYSGVVGIAPNVTGLHCSAPISHCTDAGCTAKTLVGTQLERTGARRLFPCYDMPAIKARFITKVTAPIEEAPVILGNMEAASRTVSADGNYVTVEFEPTPIMSTYLVAITAGDLRQVQGVTAPPGSAYKIRGWAVPGKEESMAEAVRIGYKAFEYYTKEYTSVTQPIKTYDFVAFPGKAFAMENWGLLIFDEGRALYNATTSGAYGLVRVASVVCHEVAHQWWGNLATCATWTQLLVNEGLASEVEYDCMQYAAPELSADVLRYKVVAPGGDARSAHEGPLSTAMILSSDSLTPAASPASDFELNDVTVERNVYAKGASIYFMLRYALNQLMGPLGQFWKPTLNQLLAEYQYGSMVFSDIFYTALELYGPVYRERVGPGKEIEVMNWAGGLYLKTEQLRSTRGDLQKERAFNIEGDPSLITWVYSPAYPLLDTRKPGTINPADYLETLTNIGTNQTRYCAYNFTPEEADAYNLSEDQKLRINTACESPDKFTNVIVMHNLTDCAASKSFAVSTVAGPIDYGPVAADSWVLNQHAARLWRAVYTDVHFDNLVAEVGEMVACPAERDTTDVLAGSDNYCCAAAGDLLETSGVLTDAAVFSQDGTYSVEQTMRMVEAVIRAPVASTGLGQYLLLHTAVEVMEVLEGFAAENVTCAAIMDEFQSDMLRPYSQAILQAALKPFDAGTNATIGVDGTREAFLARLVVSPLLLSAAYVPPNAVNGAPDAGGGDFGGGKRRSLLQTEEEEEATAGVPATAPGPAAALEDAEEGLAPAPAPAEDDQAAESPETKAPAPIAAPAPTEYINGDLELQAELCALLPSTPLWKDYINAGSTSTAATSTTSVPVDLLPGIYALAAAMPPGCRTGLEGSYAATSLAQTQATIAGEEAPFTDISTGIVQALNECYHYHESISEGVRCLNALAATGNPRAVVGFTPNLSRPTFTNVYTVAERKGFLTNLYRPWVLSNIARRSTSAYVELVDDLESGDLWEAMGTVNACGTLNIMAFLAAPTNMAQVNALEKIINGRAQQCSPTIVGRMKGKALLAKNNAARTQQQMCAYLEDWQARKQ